MKLDEKMKKQIDSFFESISANELYDILTQKYRFPKHEIKEDSCEILVNNKKYDIFEKIAFGSIDDANYSKYCNEYNNYSKQKIENISSENTSYSVYVQNDCPLALAS